MSKCYLCDAVATERDHCHATGLCRGELCRRCNIVVGLIEGHPNIEAAIAYAGSTPIGPSYQSYRNEWMREYRKDNEVFRAANRLRQQRWRAKNPNWRKGVAA